MKYKLIKQGIFSLTASVVIMATTPLNVHAYEYTDDPMNTTNETLFGEDRDINFEDNWQGWAGKNDWKEMLEPSYTTNEYSMYHYESITTQDLFFVRIDGETYLATKLIDTNASNIISKYYAIDTGDFLGQTLEINWYARAVEQAKKMLGDEHKNKTDNKEIFNVNVSEALGDQNYFNGEYGLGKNLPISSIINVSDVFSNKRLSCKQIATLLDYDPIYLATFTDKYRYNDYIFRTKEEYTISIPDHTYYLGINIVQPLIKERYCTVLYSMEASSYIAEEKKYFYFQTDNGTKTIVGYRASNNPNDSGYHYLYDIESSNIIDLSHYYKLTETFSSGPDTIHDIRSSITNPMNNCGNIDEILVLDTRNLEGDQSFEDYYLITRKNYDTKMENPVFFTSIAESKSNSITGNYDLSTLTIMKDGNYKCTPENQNMWDISTLRDCLKNNNMDFLIKDTYSQRELSMLIERLRKQDLHLFGEDIQRESAERFVTAKLEDIIVVDTTKYDEEDYLGNIKENVLIKNTNTRYFILIPYEMKYYAVGNTKYYDSWDHTAKAAVEPLGIRIDNLGGTLFYMLNLDGNLQCISPLSDVLNELGLSEFIQEEYVIGELGEIQEQLNCVNLKVKEKN